MKLRLDIGGLELHTSWTDRMWYVIWVEVRRYRNRDDIRTFWPGCRWGRTWMEMKRTSMAFRWDLGVAELHFFGHGWRWDVTGMEVRCKYQDRDWGETRPGWSWDFNMGACMEVRCEYGALDWIEMQPRLGRDANLWTFMETVHGWRRDKNLVTWISLSRTRMEVWRTYWNLDGFEMVPGWIWDVSSEDWNGGETSPCCCSEANIWTWIEVRHDLDGEETWILERRLRWDVNHRKWMGVRWDLDWVKLHILIHGKVGIGLGWSWCAILVTWMEVTCDLEWGETPNSGPGWRWDVTWMEVRFESSDLDTDDTVHIWGRLQDLGT